MNDSVFSKIIRRELPAEIIYEDASSIVILSIEPHNPGHSLVVPKEVSTGDFWQMDSDQLSEIVVLAQKISKVIKDTLNPARIGLVFEGFGVQDHVHINLIPINKPGDLDHDHARSVSAAELAVVGEKLRAAIKKAGISS